MKSIKHFLFSLLCMICSCVVFAKNEITIEEMVPVYDENSGVIVSIEDEVHNVIFNDKDQEVKYNIVLKNNTDKDISLDSIVLPEPDEEFLKYELTGVDVLKAKSANDVVLSLETIETEGWGRNFTLELTDQVYVDTSVGNPNTEVKSIIGTLVGVSLITGVLIFVVRNKRISRYAVLIVVFGSVITFANADYLIEFPIKLSVSFESQNIMKPAYVVDDDEKGKVDYWVFADRIKNIYVQNEFSEISNYFKKFDVSNNNNDRVIAYLTINEEDFEFYDLYLQADGIIYMNSDASMYFDSMYYLDNIDNIDGLATEDVINMSNMFDGAGYNSEKFTLDVSNFDTSNVTNMSGMFNNTGVTNKSFTLDVSNFDTSKVTDMSNMFAGAGYNSEEFILDVRNFDTSHVTDMQYMFYQSGYSSPIFTLDISNFDTSNVTNMYAMFCHTGYKNEKFLLDVSNFDTSKVTDMSYMFAYMGYNTIDFSLNLSNFDTSKVTDMKYMFSHTAHNSDFVALELSSFDTRNVTNMKNMFECFGFYGANFHLDLSHFDTSNVTNMYQMFYETASYSPDFRLTLGDSFKTNKVTDMGYMFAGTGWSSNKFTLDVSGFDTSNVTNMTRMFYETGYNNTTFDIDLSGFDFSKVTNMAMFLYQTGYNSTALTTKLNLNYPNPKAVVKTDLFKNVAVKNGTSIVLDYTSKTSVWVSDFIKIYENSNLSKGKLTKVYVDDAAIGDEIYIKNEKFYVIDTDDTTITLFPVNAIGSNNIQSTTPVLVPFASEGGWEYEPGPMEIGSNYYSTELKNVLDGYYNYLKDVTSDESIIVELLTLEELGYTSCSIYDDYYYDDEEYFYCVSSMSFKIDADWWTKSAVSNEADNVWYVSENRLYISTFGVTKAVRPKVVISKETLKDVVKDQIVS